MKEVSTQTKGGSYLVHQQGHEEIFTPEDFTEEQKMIAKTARQFVEKEVEPHREEIENQDFDLTVRLLKEAGNLGLLAHSVSESYGGLGLDKISKALVGETIGGTGSYGVAHSNHTCIATLPITYYGTAHQKEKYLPKLASGEYLGAYCLTEPSAGSDAMSGKTTAVLNDEKTHYLLNGTKIYITNAVFSDTFIVYAKIDGQFSAFIVEKDFPGLSLGPEEKKMGISGSSTRSVIMENCEVPMENLLGETGKGHLIAFNVLNLGRFNLGAACTGAAKQAFELALTHTGERKQFRRKLADFGATKEKIALMASRLYASESLQYRTAFLLEEALGELYEEKDSSVVTKKLAEFSLECAICKVYGSETLDQVTDEAVQLHGGAGFIKEYRIEQMYRDSRINRIFEGTNEINRLLVSGQFMKKSLKGELPFQAAHSEAKEILSQKGQSWEDFLKTVRASFLILTAKAQEVYGEKLEDKQEVVMKLSEIAILLYAAESAVLRTKKAAAANSEQQEKIKHLLTETILEDTACSIISLIRQLEPSLLLKESSGQVREAIYNRLLSFHFPGSLQGKREIADWMYSQSSYSV
ncbi:acyl-CoA dehydrogenase family protein [Thalassorhabdus alkalitolerans]|uniref:Acyl-CoA dehydrogenase family protein n=1 Tax=Thalassorhabdus alkalitolerans TaxID=2282697 RepID=A0ABW0YLG8_9BACI